MNRMRGKSKEDGSAAKHCRIRSYHRFVASKEKPRQRELAGLLIAWVIQNPGCTPLHTGGNLFRPGTKPWSHRLKFIGLSARRCQCPQPKTLLNALACLKKVRNGRVSQFPDSITESWPLTIDRCRSSIRK